jgi:hypothetical protein
MKNMKRITIILLVSILLIPMLSITTHASVTTSSRLNRFEQRLPVPRFTDIAGRADAQDIIDAHRYGIISSANNTRYNPNGLVTGAEAVVMAAKIHAIYMNGFDRAYTGMGIDRFSANQTTLYGKYLTYGLARALFDEQVKGLLYTPLQISDETRDLLELAGFSRWEWTSFCQYAFHSRSNKFFTPALHLSNVAFPWALSFFAKNEIQLFPPSSGRQIIMPTRAQVATLWMALDESIIQRDIIVQHEDIRAVDITNHPLKESIIYCIQRGYIANSTTIRPNNEITMYELATYTANSLLSADELNSLLRDIVNFQPRNPSIDDTVAFRKETLTHTYTLQIPRERLYDLRTTRAQELPLYIAIGYASNSFSITSFYPRENPDLEFVVEIMMWIIRDLKGWDFLKGSVH